MIEVTTGWFLGTIAWWDGREHTLSLGFGHYLSTFEVLLSSDTIFTFLFCLFSTQLLYLLY